MSGRWSLALISLAALLGLLAIGWIVPGWARFLLTMAFAKGMVALGIVALMRGGLVSFGQGLYYCLGAYFAALLSNVFASTDLLLVSLGAGLVCGLVGILLGPVLATYRGIFFAMLSLALSMIIYGTFVKLRVVGGSDGMNVAAPTLLGYAPDGPALNYLLYGFTVALAVVLSALVRSYFGSSRGLLSLAAKDNELRVEYLGASVRAIMSANYVIAAVLGGIGGGIAGLAIGHVDPEYAFWTTSGEFVFVAILAGHLSIAAVFVSAILLELVRSFSNLYFPNTWQLALGSFLVVVILLLPDGLGSMWRQLRRRRAAQRAAAAGRAPGSEPREAAP